MSAKGVVLFALDEFTRLERPGMEDMPDAQQPDGGDGEVVEEGVGESLIVVAHEHLHGCVPPSAKFVRPSVFCFRLTCPSDA